jgi:hypothetical protein
MIVGEVAHRGNVRVERWVRRPHNVTEFDRLYFGCMSWRTSQSRTSSIFSPDPKNIVLVGVIISKRLSSHRYPVFTRCKWKFLGKILCSQLSSSNFQGRIFRDFTKYERSDANSIFPGDLRIQLPTQDRGYIMAKIPNKKRESIKVAIKKAAVNSVTSPSQNFRARVTGIRMFEFSVESMVIAIGIKRAA